VDVRPARLDRERQAKLGSEAGGRRPVRVEELRVHHVEDAALLLPAAEHRSDDVRQQRRVERTAQPGHDAHPWASDPQALPCLLLRQVVQRPVLRVQAKREGRHRDRVDHTNLYAGLSRQSEGLAFHEDAERRIRRIGKQG